MKKFFNGLLIITVFLLSSCGESIDSKMVGKWTLTEVKSDEGAIDQKVMGVNEVYINLKKDNTYEGLYYGVGGEGLEDVSGEWFTNDAGVDDGLADLFLEMGDGNEILLVKKIEENKMVLRSGSADFIFEIK